MCDTSAPFNLGLTALEISMLSDKELAKGCRLARELVKMGNDKLTRTNEQLKAITRVRAAIPPGDYSKTPAMRESGALLRKEYEALHDQEKAQRADHQSYLITRQPWDEEKRARDKAANQKRLDDLRTQVLESFDNDLLQAEAENSCHCHCHCHCH